MSRLTIALAVPTDPDWGAFIAANFDAFLVDHANCERKASAFALGLIVKYPDRTGLAAALIDIALEELEHFRRVFELMAERGLAIGSDERDVYVAELNALARHGRDERLIDRLLIAGLIEKRGAERFALLAESLSRPHLARFYHDLANSEKKHSQQFVNLVRPFAPESVLHSRLEQLVEAEGAIMQSLPRRAALH